MELLVWTLLVVALGALLAIYLMRNAAGRAAAESARMLARSNESLLTAHVEAESHQRVLDGVSEAVVVADRDGRVVFRNATMTRLAGDQATQALVDDAVAGVLADARAGAPANRTLELSGPPRLVLELRGVALAGGAAAAYARDVSAFQQLDRVRRDFVANVSHELKTPVGALSLLGETLAGEDDPDVIKRLAGRMSGEADRLGRMVDELLDLSTLEAGPPLERDDMQVTAVVDEAVARVRPLAEAAGVAVEVGAVADVTVSGDRRLLVSAVANLLDNAVKYSDQGSPVRVDATADDGVVTFVVADHGIGIPARDRERIFERFYRVDKARARATGGTGLGLSIVRHVAETHGGSVTFESREGQGSTFRLTVPT